MITASDIVEVASRYNAVCTETSQIYWSKQGAVRDEWTQTDSRPSVMDALILDSAWRTGPSYLKAVSAATGWGDDTWRGFQTIMLLGEPVETSTMSRQNMAYWHGIIVGLFVYEALKKRGS